MKANVVHTFKLPIEFEEQLFQYTHDHYITKSDFIRNAVIEKLEELSDSALINEILERKEKRYSFKEAKRVLKLED
jgi:predicted DNA-binding protein